MKRRREIKIFKEPGIDPAYITATAIGGTLDFYSAVKAMEEEGAVLSRGGAIYFFNHQTKRHMAIMVCLLDLKTNHIFDCEKNVYFTIDEVMRKDAWHQIDPASIGLALGDDGNYHREVK